VIKNNQFDAVLLLFCQLEIFVVVVVLLLAQYYYCCLNYFKLRTSSSLSSFFGIYHQPTRQPSTKSSDHARDNARLLATLPKGRQSKFSNKRVT
jgi:hypothetical protein